jgi:RNA recognition motif-containing protein
MRLTSSSSVQPSSTLFIGSLPTEVSETELRTYFSKFGRILRAKLIVDLETLLSKQCALLFCGSKKISEKILLSGPHEFHGRYVRLNYAEENKKGTKCFVENTLFIGNIKLKTKESQLRSYFERFGQLISVKIFSVSPQSQTNNAIINYKDNSSIQEIFTRPNSHKVDGRTLRCSRYRPKDRNTWTAEEANQESEFCEEQYIEDTPEFYGEFEMELYKGQDSELTNYQEYQYYEREYEQEEQYYPNNRWLESYSHIQTHQISSSQKIKSSNQANARLSTDQSRSNQKSSRKILQNSLSKINSQPEHHEGFCGNPPEFSLRSEFNQGSSFHSFNWEGQPQDDIDHPKILQTRQETSTSESSITEFNSILGVITSNLKVGSNEVCEKSLKWVFPVELMDDELFGLFYGSPSPTLSANLQNFVSCKPQAQESISRYRKAAQSQPIFGSTFEVK